MAAIIGFSHVAYEHDRVLPPRYVKPANAYSVVVFKDGKGKTSYFPDFKTAQTFYEQNTAQQKV